MLVTKPLPEAQNREILLEVDATGIKCTDWVSEHKSQINQLLDKHGVLLIRGLKVQQTVRTNVKRRIWERIGLL